MNRATVLRRLRALVHAVVADHAGYADPIIVEDLRAASGLAAAMLGNVAPCLDRRFIAVERQRQELAFLGQALEPFDRDETVDLLQDRPQLGGEVDIILSVPGLRPDFEDNGDHYKPPFSQGGDYSPTLRKKVRSSARMNWFASAKLKLAMPSASPRSRAR